jgi:hypothetical protein
MLRALTAAALVVSFPTFADEDDDAPAAQPSARLAAEAKVIAVKMSPTDDGFAWAEATLKITRCVAGASCALHQTVTVQIPVAQWRGKHGDVMGLVRYAWKDRAGAAHSWSLALNLDDVDQKDRFDRESDSAAANEGADDSAVATR